MTGPFHPTRRLALGLALGAALARPALAQPRGTVRVIVGFPPGGSADTTARLLAERLRGGYAQTIIVENRIGAAGRLAIEAVKAADPDGGTILLTPASMLVIFPHLYQRSLRYDPFADLIPVCPAGEFPFGMGVGPMAGHAASLRDFIAWGRGRAEIPYGSAAAGSVPHFMGVQLARAAGLSMTHIPYRGSAPAIQDLIAGRTACSFHPMVDLAPHAAGGQVRLAAVSSAERLPRFPDVPTVAEQGYPQLTGSEWFGLFLPARTPAAVVEALNRAAVEASAAPEYREALARLEMRPFPLAPAAFLARVRADYEKWGPIIAESGFKPEEG
jgi:tripartite-type tricarboxylate transporter receptor subunit TctC